MQKKKRYSFIMFLSADVIIKVISLYACHTWYRYQYIGLSYLGNVSHANQSSTHTPILCLHIMYACECDIDVSNFYLWLQMKETSSSFS